MLHCCSGDWDVTSPYWTYCKSLFLTKLLCFLTYMASFRLLLCHFDSLSTTMLLFQSILWFSLTGWCATTDFCRSRFMQHHWCSFSGKLNVVQVSSMYEQSQSIQEIRYTTPVVSIGTVMSFTLVRRDLSVLPDRNITLMPTLGQILLIFSLTPRWRWLLWCLLFHSSFRVRRFLYVDSWTTAVRCCFSRSRETLVLHIISVRYAKVWIMPFFYTSYLTCI